MQWVGCSKIHWAKFQERLVERHFYKPTTRRETDSEIRQMLLTRARRVCNSLSNWSWWASTRSKQPDTAQDLSDGIPASPTVVTRLTSNLHNNGIITHYTARAMIWFMIYDMQCRCKPRWGTLPEGNEFSLNFLTTFLFTALQQVVQLLGLSLCKPSFTLHIRPFTTIWGPFTQWGALLPQWGPHPVGGFRVVGTGSDDMTCTSLTCIQKLTEASLG